MNYGQTLNLNHSKLLELGQPTLKYMGIGKQGKAIFWAMEIVAVLDSMIEHMFTFLSFVNLHRYFLKDYT